MPRLLAPRRLRQWGKHSIVPAGLSLYCRAMKNISLNSCSCLLASSFAFMLMGTGCSTAPNPPVLPGTGSDSVSRWDGDSMTGSPSVRISLSEQRAYFYKGDQLAGVSLISSGREGRATVALHSLALISYDGRHGSNVLASTASTRS